MSSKDKLQALKSTSKDAHDKDHPPVKDTSAPTTSKNTAPIVVEAPPSKPTKIPCWKRCSTYLYDPKTRLFCGRSCRSWWCMLLYSIMYLIFLSTYTMIFLYTSLTIIKMTAVYEVADKAGITAFSDNGIGLTATPTSLVSVPLISYTYGDSEEYSKYIKSLDDLLVRRRKRHAGNFTDLGPCGKTPYGYGDNPCVIIRPNKQIRWSAKPIQRNATEDAPKELLDWLELKEQKLWLHCAGYHSYDKEHIGSFTYYPYPPGFDPSVFPLDMQSDAPLVAIQISNFTLGLSLTVECKMWYDSGVSSIAFLLYVDSKNRSVTHTKV